ncbi:MAG: hypothetical protein IJG37_10180 [Synergistaceae bacterium]|nr:hypothetical protein [Synergistaceae bacterium]MBQ3653728.1 hypothetical protein [Synergistaceae bacterium]
MAETISYAQVNELRTELREVKGELRALSSRVDSLMNMHLLGVACFWIILASAVIVSAALRFRKELFAPAVTAEDVKRMTDAAINKYLADEYLASMIGGKAE